jgi:2-polyprenyl-3-methyl-5-hydroxy-6-metoxy-1,4-benzoquinol methylase
MIIHAEVPDMLASLVQRECIPELMDDPTLPAEDHRHALAGLSRLNTLSRSHQRRWAVIMGLARQSAAPLRVLDLATGDGRFPILLATQARRAKLTIEVAGCDMSDTALSVARESAQQSGVSAEFFPHDVLRESLPRGFDVITSSLFLHHLEQDAVRHLLRQCGEAARTMVLMSDLSRSRRNYLLVWLACRLVTRSRVVWTDGPLSVRAAFTPEELRTLAEESGLLGATTIGSFPCEFMLCWRRV